MRDMICPVPETFHLRVGPELIHGLIDMAARHPQERCFFHLKAYRDEKLLFAFHDAFDGSPLLVSERVEPERIKAFCEKLGLSYRREQNEQKRDVEVLQRLLSMMEDPAKVRMLWPWWKRALLFWKK